MQIFFLRTINCKYLRSPFWMGCVLLLFSQAASIQLPEYGAPVRGEVVLNGTFGELRPNHFHGGIDIRGPIGTPIYAIGDGYISRIFTSGGSYGQALYIQHPEGYTSLYAHLEGFREDITTFLRDQQYQQEEFSLDLEPSPDQFPVRRGDLIGYMGMRGFAFGPHLHFEIRETYSNKVLNPLRFGIQVNDHKKPSLRSLRVYALDERGNVNAAYNQAIVQRKDGSYGLFGQDTLLVDAQRTAFAIKAYDQQDARNNENGIYSLDMQVEGVPAFGYKLDFYNQTATRCLNAHLDYPEQELRNSWYQRCFVLPGNGLGLYSTNANRGALVLQPGEAQNIRLVIGDFAGNTSSLYFVVKRKPQPDKLPARGAYTYFLPYNEASIIDDGALRAHFPEGSFYEDLYLHYTPTPENTQGLYSKVYQLGDRGTPVHHYFDLELLPENLPKHLEKKAFVAYCEDGGTPRSLGGEWTRAGRLKTQARALGNFCIMVDTVPPTITPMGFSADMRTKTSFGFSLSDNFPVDGKASSFRYRATVDGQWILMEMDAKTRRLTHTFDGKIPPGEHAFLLHVMDDRGNMAAFEGTFRR